MKKRHGVFLDLRAAYSFLFAFIASHNYFAASAPRLGFLTSRRRFSVPSMAGRRLPISGVRPICELGVFRFDPNESPFLRLIYFVVVDAYHV